MNSYSTAIMPMDMHNQAIQRNWQVQFKRQAKEQNNARSNNWRLWMLPFCQTSQLETSGIIKRKWNDIYQLKQSLQSNQAIHLHFHKIFDYYFAKKG